METNEAAPPPTQLTTHDLAKRLKHLDVEIARLTEEKKGLEGEYEQVEQALLERMEAEELDNFTLAGVGRFGTITRTFPRVTKENLPRFLTWLDERGLGSLAPRGVNAQTLGAQYRDWEKNDQPLPPEDVVQVFRKTTVSIKAA